MKQTKHNQKEKVRPQSSASLFPWVRAIPQSKTHYSNVIQYGIWILLGVTKSLQEFSLLKIIIVWLMFICWLEWPNKRENWWNRREKKVVGNDLFEWVSTEQRSLMCIIHEQSWFVFCTSLCTLWRRKWQLTPVFLRGESHGQRSLANHGP